MAVTVRRKDHYDVADCDALDAIGDMVRITADAISGIKQVTKLDIVASPMHLAWGMIISKISTTRCVVQTGGEVIGVYTGLTPGRQLFINSASRLTHDVPTHPSSGVKSVHPAAQAVASDALFLRIQTPSVIRA